MWQKITIKRRGSGKSFMIYFIAYDIREDKVRNRLIKKIQELGFVRIQKSLFLGDIQVKTLLSLEVFIGDLLSFNEDSIYLFPQCLEDFHNTIFISKLENQKRFISELVII